MTKKRKSARQPEPPPVEHVEETREAPTSERPEFASIVDVDGILIRVTAPTSSEEIVRLSIAEPSAVSMNVRQARAVRDAINSALRLVARDPSPTVHVTCNHPDRDDL
jgi:hypothetical protein